MSLNTKNVPDTPGKFEEDTEAYERTDSGFISGDIPSESLDSGLLEEKSSSRNIIEEVNEPEAPTSMILDSGVCLSEKFSNISISKEGLNDLNAPKKQSPVDTESKKIKSDFPLFFYEPDEDGDT